MDAKIWLLLGWAACSGDEAKDTDTGSDGDTDTDADTDTDTDADTDSDSDTDTDADTDTDTDVLDATGTWLGECSAGSSSAAGIEMEILDAGGALTGTLLYTTTYTTATYTQGFVVAGARTGADVVIDVTGYTTGTGLPPDVELQLVLAGDTMTGELLYFAGEPNEIGVPCDLTR